MVLVGCITSRLKIDNVNLSDYLEESAVFQNSFTGFGLYDPAQGKFLYSHQTGKFFTPASNTKLFTFYVGRKIFPDSIPGLEYSIQNDTLYFTGTGDPTFLDPDFSSHPVYDFLKNIPYPLVYRERKLFNPRFGPGWAWDDYMYSFSPEISSMPIYSNVVRLYRDPRNPDLEVIPARFRRSILHIRDHDFKITRAEDDNEFRIFHEDYPDTVDRKIPFKYSAGLMMQLLADTLGRSVFLKQKQQPAPVRIIYSQHVDSVLKKMMLESDNFIAEQLLVMAAGQISDSLDASIAFKYGIQYLFPELNDKIHWVDGSGLSRYNQFTPEAMISLLHRIYKEIPEGTIKDLFPAGGVSGTLKNNFKNEVPYIYAKTGTLSNVYNLSGFLITKKGRWLIFSFMNNNFNVPNTWIKSEMEKILKNIYLKL